MRDLTKEELELAPAGCDYYNIIDGEVYFTDVMGIDVIDIDGNSVDNCIMDNKVFTKSRLLPKKPFDVCVYEFVDLEIGQAEVNGDGLQINMIDGSRPPIIYKRDIAVMAKALGMTAKDFK